MKMNDVKHARILIVSHCTQVASVDDMRQLYL